MNRSVTSLAFAGLASLLVAGCTQHLGRPEAAREGGAPIAVAYVVRRGVDYSEAHDLGADLYLPATDGLRPAVVVIHGGGWVKGTRGDIAGVAEDLAARGSVVLNLSYRLAPEHRHPAQISDLRDGIRWLRAHAEELRIDDRRVAAFGYSAGAHLALLAAVTGERDAGTDLQAVVGGGSPVDLRQWPDSPLVKKLLGKSLGEAPELWRAASPIAHLDAGDPPTFLYHGTIDWVVSEGQARAYFDRARELGLPCELFLARGRGHFAAYLASPASHLAAYDFLDRQLAAGR